MANQNNPLVNPHLWIRQRSRQWDKEHQCQKVTYRGVDPKIVHQVKTTAKKLGVPAGEVAQALLQYAIQSYEGGELELNPHLALNGIRNTLNPSSPWKPYNKKIKSHWRAISTWRNFSPELKQTLAHLASTEGLNVPLGELITALLKFGLKAYETQLLVLSPVVKQNGRLTLFTHGGKEESCEQS